MKLREDLRALFDQERIENVFEFDQEGIRYLIDLNHDKHTKVMDMIKKSGIQSTERKVTEIGDDEKAILSKKHSGRR